MFGLASLAARQVPKPQLLTVHEPKDGATAAFLEQHKTISLRLGMPARKDDSEALRCLLAKLDLPIYSLGEVTRYLDYKAKKAKQSLYQEWGWCWLPLRLKDHLNVAFGTEPRGSQRASDYYDGNSRLYGHVIPLRVLKRIELVEQAAAENGLHIYFAASDYATALDRKPDPFLMVMAHNPNLSVGVGRFIIDFWDEPGFGIEQMLA